MGDARDDGDGGRGTVLVTGASTGIGRACALHLASLGFSVLGGVRSEADFERLRSQGGARLQPVILDVTNGEQIAACAGRVGMESPDGLAGLVNNAGIAIAGALEAIPIEEFRRQLEVNLTGQVAVTQALLPQLRQGQGTLIFISSDNGRLAAPCLAPYSASKYAIEAVADALRVELRPFGVRVVLVEPGAIRTPIWEKTFAAAATLRERYPPELESLYGSMSDSVEASAAKLAARGVPAERVARTVARALTSVRPRARYTVGREAKLAAVIARALPDRLRDRLVARASGID
jgi:NAD(P)-dependent dehydrogenase (short-subunit alcohol dehydrogenase family)